MTRLNGAHVLVTGGSEGIGLATARLALERGARVSILSRSPDKLAVAVASLGTRVESAAADVTRPAELQAAVNGLVDRLGPVAVLVAAAGGAEPGRFEQLDTEVFHRQMELNYFGSVHAIRAVLPGMLSAQSGHVVLISSTAGLCGVFGYGGYSPCKAALQNLAEVLLAEHADGGLRVSVVHPPDTLTPGFEREARTMPPETVAVSALVKPLSAGKVARALITGVERDRRVITADLSTSLLARGTTLVAPVFRASMRRAVRRSRR